MISAKLFCLLSLPLLALSRPQITDFDKFVEGNRIFTSKLYNEVEKAGKGNFIFSPLSVETVLALVQSGAKDETAVEIKESLHIPFDEDEIEGDFKSLTTAFLTPQNYSINTANKLYVKEGLVIKENFKTIAEDVYQAGLQNINFQEAAEAAEAINEWVAESTNDKIKNLIDPTNIDESTIAILINAVHFAGSWTQLFDTVQNVFYNTPDSTVQSSTIYSRDFQGLYYYNEKLQAQFLDLPFLGDGASMLFVLPDAKDGLEALENQIDEVFANSLSLMELKFVEVSIPKFTIETKTQLTGPLQNLGMHAAFSPLRADFSNIVGQKGDLYISDVHQKAFISLDEKGVEADAATAVDIIDSVRPVPTASFIATHPFLFYIKVDDVIIFAGRVATLEAEE